VIDGVAGPGFDTTAHELAFSYDGQVAVYAAVRGDEWFVVENEELHGPYPGITQPVFSPTSHDIAYGVNGPDSGYMTMNHKVYGRHHHALAPIFSSDGGRFAYWASDKASGNTFVVCDSIAGPGSYSVATPTFSAHDVLFYTSYLDSTGNRRVFYAEDRRLGEMTGIFDYRKFTTSAERGPVFGRVCTPPKFSPDGRDVAYRASQLEDHEVVVVGGVADRAYELVRPKAVEFETDGSLVYYGVEERERLYRITLRPIAAE